jgi:UPF0755 protein
MKKVVLIVILPPILASIMIGVHLLYLFNKPYEGKTVTFKIAPGEGFSKINYRLYKNDLISNSHIFHYYSKYLNVMSKFKAGSYEIKDGDTMNDIIDTFVNGKPILTSVTIPEGKNMYEVGKILEANKICTYDDFVKAAKQSANLIGVDAPSVEGYLFPETYKFAPGTDPVTVIKAMLSQFEKATSDIDFSKSHLSKHQVIILASVVEKETGAKVERPTISGVFHNRLKKRMRLQSDPTTIYGIYENFNGNLRKKHLLEKTPYNTYKISGLPLGPISNPSKEAIKAVINPEKHKFLYFVSKNDGTHVFTPTYKDHLRAVQNWQLNGRNRKGKSWRDLKQ